MRWTGYKKKNTYGKPEGLPKDSQEMLEYTYQDQKKRLKVNFIEFIVGFILLAFSWSYLQTHPAEKVAFFTGIDVMIQKASIRFSSDDKALKGKYDLEKSFVGLLSSAESGNCLNDEDISHLKKQYISLKKLSLEEYKKKKTIYHGYASTIYQRIKRQCK